jgi:hypothetical protein
MPSDKETANSREPLRRFGDDDRTARNHPARFSARKRRKLAGWLRRTANCAPECDPRRRRFEVLLRDRVAVVRAELIEIANLLERADDPDPACVATIRELLRNGCDSPLYNRDIHVSELKTTLYYVRSGLDRSSAISATGPRDRDNTLFGG